MWKEYFKRSNETVSKPHCLASEDDVFFLLVG